MPSIRGLLPECWCCGREDQRHGGRGLCIRCYERWRRRGFSGPGPGPEFTPRLTRARDHLAVITTMSKRDAAAVLGLSTQTIARYRRALRRAS